MRKHWLTAIIMAALLFVQAVVVCGGALAESEGHVHTPSDWKHDEFEHWRVCTECGEMLWDERGAHVLKANDRGTYSCVCGYEEDHLYDPDTTQWVCDEMTLTEIHYQPCKICGSHHGNIEEHVYPESPDSDGNYVCAKCGYKRSHIEHKWSNEWTAVPNEHFHVCEYEGCNVHDTETAAAHTWQEIGNGTYICTTCGYEIDHEHEAETDWTYNADNHWHACTHEGCEWNADFGVHIIVNGKCIVCEYEKPHEHNWKAEWKYDATNHWHECEGCDVKDGEAVHDWTDWEGTATSHTRECTVCHYVESVDHGQDVFTAGKCDICGFTMHGAKNEWKYDENKHWHECLFEGCTEMLDKAEHDWTDWEGVATGHKRECKVCHYVESVDHGEDVYNAGKCDICGFTMHGAQDEWKYDENTHWHECKFDGCTEKFDEKDHVIIGGKCKCGYEKKHDYSDEWSYDEVDHWHACTEEGCNWTKDQAEHDWTDWEGVATSHKRECKVCHYVESVDHGEDVYNAGKCDICGFTMHGAQDEWKNDETNHWHGCKFDGCEEKYNEAEHTWGEWIAEGTFHERECTVCHRVQHENHDLTDGKCDICGFTMHGAQDEWKNDETNHWHGCKFDGCEEKYNEAEHTWGEWIAEGTFHERECTVCHRVQHENHDLTDGKCDICGFTMHGAQDEWKNDEHTHWHGCKFDGCKDKFDENEHDFVNGVCSVCGYRKIEDPVYDDVQPVIPAPLPPQTGDASYLAIGIGMIAAALCIALRKRQSN